MSILEWLLHLLVLVAGYAAGRGRPVGRLVDWNWHRIIRSSRANAADVVLWVVLHPAKALLTLRRSRAGR